MGKSRRIVINLALVLGLVLGLGLGALGPGPVVADDVDYYPTEDTYIRDDSGVNYGSSTWLSICDMYEDESNDNIVRTLIRIDDQSGGGNITSVLLKLYYGDEFEDDAEGKYVRVYRCTRDFIELEADWYEWENGSSWTSEGGDWTTANYAQAQMPSEGNWITWNITNMALDAWDESDDLYVIIRYKYENKDLGGPGASWSFFRSNENGGTSFDPKVVVSYDEEIQTPEVDSDIDEYGSSYVDLEIYPTLYDWPSANVTAQVSVHDAGAWNWESSLLNITNNNAVIRTVTGLNKSTEYDVRAKLVYASGTVYSTLDTFTTPAYTMPTFDKDVDDIGIQTATVYASWTGNTDGKNIFAKVAYKREELGSWSYTSTKSSTATSNEFDWDLDTLHNDWTYDYKALFTIDGYTYSTNVSQFATLDYADLDVEVSDVDIEHIQLKVDYDCVDADEIDLYTRIREDGTSAWTYSDTREGLTGNGTEYFTFENLKMVTLYEWEAVAEFDGIEASFLGEAWTLSIDVYPVLSNLQASFIQPNIMRVSCDIVLNDVSWLDPDLYTKYKRTTASVWSTSIAETVVSDDGNWSVDILCGDELLWETGYDFYAVLDYTAGTNQTDADVFYTPEEPFAVETVGFEGVTGTSVKLHGRLQISAFDVIEVKFFYWLAGTDEKFIVGQQSMTSSGMYETVLGGLVYGDYYNFQAFAIDPVWLTQWRAGSIIQFRAGHWDDVPVDDDGVYGVYARMWNWISNSTAGHWLVLVFGMGMVGIIFQRRREVAIIMCLLILGVGIAVGWVDTWIIVLLALGAGLTIWRMVSGRRESAV